MMIVSAGPAMLKLFDGFVPDDAEFRQVMNRLSTRRQLNQTIIQAVFWIATLGVLILLCSGGASAKTELSQACLLR